MGYYWGGKWHDEPEPTERIAARAAARARETGRKVTISTGRRSVTATPSGSVKVSSSGSGGGGSGGSSSKKQRKTSGDSGSISQKPKASAVDQEAKPSEKPKEQPQEKEGTIKVYIGETSTGQPIYREVRVEDVQRMSKEELAQRYGQKAAENIRVEKTGETTRISYISGAKKEYTVSREFIEKATGKKYKGLKERVPLWQAKQILQKEGVQYREEEGTIIVEREPTPTEKMTMALEAAVEQQRLEAERKKEGALISEIPPDSHKALAKELPLVTHIHTPQPGTKEYLLLQQRREQLRQEYGEFTKAALREGAIFASGFAFGGVLGTIGRVAPRAARFIGVTTGGAATGIYGKETYEIIKSEQLTKEQKLENIGILTSEFIIGGAGTYAGIRTFTPRATAEPIILRKGDVAEGVFLEEVNVYEADVIKPIEGGKTQYIGSTLIKPKLTRRLFVYEGQEPASRVEVEVYGAEEVSIGSEAQIPRVLGYKGRMSIRAPKRDGGKLVIEEFKGKELEGMKPVEGEAEAPGMFSRKAKYKLIAIKEEVKSDVTDVIKPDLEGSKVEIIRTPKAKRALKDKLYGKESRPESYKFLEKYGAGDKKSTGGKAKAELERPATKEKGVLIEITKPRPKARPKPKAEAGLLPIPSQGGAESAGIEEKPPTRTHPKYKFKDKEKTNLIDIIKPTTRPKRKTETRRSIVPILTPGAATETPPGEEETPIEIIDIPVPNETPRPPGKPGKPPRRTKTPDGSTASELKKFGLNLLGGKKHKVKDVWRYGVDPRKVKAVIFGSRPKKRRRRKRR